MFSLIQIEEKVQKLEQGMFLLLFQNATFITAADFSPVFISFSPCDLIILQDSKQTCDPEGLLGPVVYEIK